MMLHAKYESSSPHGLRRRCLKFFLSVAIATKILNGISVIEVF